MRLLKLLLTGALALLAIVAGLVATVVAALTGAAIMLARRAMSRSRSTVAAGHSHPPRPRPAPDAIDVVATEVPAEPPSR